ncbi:GNAT family N-acetyltransferase [Salinarimonas chemoclinalis]|uniref:GNAT family N-acetyltransferase n=1 Tax=Salinarimonas chemoclinalis TaxID=3241599 RepID=UPI003558B06D
MPALTIDVLDRAELERERDAWDTLAQDARAANPFFARPLVDTHLAHRFCAPRPRFACVSAGARLVALLPVTARAGRLGWCDAPGVLGSPFCTLSTPLVARGAPDGWADALVLAIRRACRGGAFLFPMLPVASPIGIALREAFARIGADVAALAPFQRPVLSVRTHYEAYVAEALGRSRRKGLERRRRRLAEHGRVAHRVARGGAALAQAVDDFMALERSGWKGRMGTALATDPVTRAFARALFLSARGPVTARADIIALDDAPIAASLALVSAGTAFLVKTTYDERHGALGPGVMLEDAIVRALHEERFCDRLDSATLPGSVLETLYPDRVAIADVAVNLRPGDPLFPARVATERWQRNARGRVKRVPARESA